MGKKKKSKKVVPPPPVYTPEEEAKALKVAGEFSTAFKKALNADAKEAEKESS